MANTDIGDGYRRVKFGEFIIEGDEYYRAGKDRWEPTNCIGQKFGTGTTGPYIMRRLVKSRYKWNSATMQLPHKMRSRIVWIGCYGGHFDVVVVFNKKPKKIDSLSRGIQVYDPIFNKDIVAGTFDKDEFNSWFGTNIMPSNTEITEIERYRLTASWKCGLIQGLHTKVD